MPTDLYSPGNLLLQWHITEQCNLRCKHCYQDTYQKEELSLEQLCLILEQFKNFIFSCSNQTKRKKIPAHITVTGGEPFLRPDLFTFLEILYQNRKSFSFALLTNGTMITEKNVLLLKRLRPRFVQISIEGCKATHDNIRGKGTYQRAIAALALLRKKSIPTFISFTAYQNNYLEFPDVAHLGRKVGVARIWADRIIPTGNGLNLKQAVLSPDETKKFFALLLQEKRRTKRWWPFGRTEITMNRGLQFLVGGGKPYFCKAGDSLLTILPNGDLVPCRRMPIIAGNLLKKHIKDIYYESNLLHVLRDHSRISNGCELCSYAANCRGGLKCLSFAMTGDPFTADPGCWLVDKVHKK